MTRRLRRITFKNFRQNTLHLGSFTSLIGANASGKSSLRDAFRFLIELVANTPVEIIGEKYGKGVVLQWRSI